MPRSRADGRSSGAATRHAILDATLRIAAERGYVGTSLGMIKRAVGSSSSSALYWHFSTKDDLLAEALSYGFDLWNPMGPRWGSAPADADLTESLRDHLRTVPSALAEEPAFWRMGLMVGLENGPAVGSGPRRRFLELRLAASEELRQWWQASAGLDEESSAVVAALTMEILDAFFLAHESDGPSAIESLIDPLAVGLNAVATKLRHEGLPKPSPRRRPASRRVTPGAPGQAAADLQSLSRERLIAAAAEVASESGYEGASIARICSRAGLPASSLYWHFKDKDALIAEALEYTYAEWRRQLADWVPTTTPGSDWRVGLMDYMTASIEAVRQGPPFLRLGIMLLLTRRQRPPAGRSSFLAIRERSRTTTAERLRSIIPAAGAAPDHLAYILMLLSDGLFLAAQLGDPPTDSSVVAQLLLCLITATIPAGV